MEFGPRALGGRSIIGDARSPKMQSMMNLKIKFRESLPAVRPVRAARSSVGEYFELDRPVALHAAGGDVAREAPRADGGRGAEDARDSTSCTVVRSDVPAITHVDYSARIQTVDRETNPLLLRR
ncbi:MAG: hypothetical protein MZV64_28900 [Ignavibacteriales bacterium]|nr:hypothetical protein [Ignavibacteriales bacterium]